MAKRARACNVIAAPPDTSITEMNRLERVIWLQHHGIADERILDALFDPTDPELERFTTELAATLKPRSLSDG
ncbi:hypothetical protein [Arthrobacter bambusae]|uniref:Uncharacterized protein n=1 Tax=Arthrobacter bambusae TaxID=1338426 RepID=A0AAW8D8X5_9MICC|nr:hypothetical protein [Arthrobacter bambusae]MDP9904732.1 hypothetical protein [Arthrobacter bambusae]MDQ0129548.1 hypothetical protein [Arthrobacter bambusae]MDQ0180839.1 hypothetical protein [Arthrobacter bambusae]